MRDYLANRYKKAVLEEFIIEHLKDFRTKEGLSIVSVDISTLISGNSANLSVVYKSEFFDEYGSRNEYASQKLLISLMDDDRIFIKSSCDTSDVINNIFMLFRRGLNIDKIV